MVGLKGFGRWH